MASSPDSKRQRTASSPNNGGTLSIVNLPHDHLTSILDYLPKTSVALFALALRGEHDEVSEAVISSSTNECWDTLDFTDIGEIYFLHDDLPGLRRSSFTLTHDTYLNDAITGDIDWYKKGYHWSTDSCTIKAKVNAVGQVSGRSMKHRLFYVRSTSLSTLLLWPAFRSHWCMSQKTTPTFILTFAKITGTSSRSTGTAITRKTTTMFQLEIPVEMESVNLSHLEAACAMLSYQRLVFSRTCQQAWSKYSPN